MYKILRDADDGIGGKSRQKTTPEGFKTFIDLVLRVHMVVNIIQDSHIRSVKLNFDATYGGVEAKRIDYQPPFCHQSRTAPAFGRPVLADCSSRQAGPPLGDDRRLQHTGDVLDMIVRPRLCPANIDAVRAEPVRSGYDHGHFRAGTFS
jgi:hypothetical protein